METLVELVRALAWPVVVLVLGLTMRKPVGNLLVNTRLRRLKGGGVDAEFAQVGETVAESVRQETAKDETKLLPPGDGKSLPPGDVKPPPSQESATNGEKKPDPHTRGETSQLIAMTDYAPLAAIAAGWSTLEAALRSAMVRSGIHLKSSELTPVAMVERLIHEGVLKPDVLSSVQGLTALRNLAANRRDEDDEQVTSQRAREYVEMTNAICWVIEQQLVGHLRRRGSRSQP
jgi:hypothetical protein